MQSLEKTLTVVTGGAGLIGKSFCEGILKAGGKCLIADLDQKKSESVLKELVGKYSEKNIAHYPLDITSKASALEMISFAEGYFKQNITGLVNNAYPKTSDYGKDFFEVEYETLCKNLNMHLGGYFLISQQLAKYFEGKQKGNIINIASIYGVIVPRFEIYEGTNIRSSVEYSMIKSSIVFLTSFLAKRFKDMNIRVNSISPGGIFDNHSEKFVLSYKKHCNQKGMLNPQDLVGTLVFLLSDFSHFMTGQNLIVDDGFTL